MSTDHYAHLCRLAGKAIADFKMIAEGDRLLVGISGGVDSIMLMHVLDRLRKRAPVRFELFAVTIDEGFSGINHAPLKDYAEEQGWNLKILKTPIAELIKEKGDPNRPCGLCSRLRRGHIHGYADKLNCGKIVLGHHRDDLCVSFLMSLFRGAGLKTMAPNVPADNETKQLIRPLAYAPKDLIEVAAQQFDLPETGHCDHEEQLKNSGDRAYLEQLLPQLEKQFPNLGKNMLNSMADIRPRHLLDQRHIP